MNSKPDGLEENIRSAEFFCPWKFCQKNEEEKNRRLAKDTELNHVTYWQPWQVLSISIYLK